MSVGILTLQVRRYQHNQILLECQAGKVLQHGKYQAHSGKSLLNPKRSTLLLPATRSHEHYSNAKPTSTLLFDSVLQKRGWYTTIQFFKRLHLRPRLI